MGIPRLTIQLVTYNSLPFLPAFFESLKKQTYSDWNVVIVDNASSDQTVEFIKNQLPIDGIPFSFSKNQDNVGFSGGHNQAFVASTSELVAIVNPDVVLEFDCLEKLVAFLDANKAVGVVAPRLMREANHTVIDSLGLKMFRSRRVVEIGAGQTWNNQYTKPTHVFGVSGSFFMARRMVLDSNLINNEVFDSWYGSYKEDVDLAWRLQSAGIQTVVIPAAVAYHARGAKPADLMNDLSASKNKVSQPQWLKLNSYRNHLATIYKNDTWQNIALDFFFILWYELKKFVWFLLFSPAVLLAWQSLFKARKRLFKTRQEIAGKRTISTKEFRQWL